MVTAAADVRRLPFADGRFDVVVCADNAPPHLLTVGDVCGALAGMRRVLRPAGRLLISTRPCDELLRDRRPPVRRPRAGRWADRRRSTEWDGGTTGSPDGAVRYVTTVRRA